MSLGQSLRDILASMLLTIDKRARILLDPRYFELWERNGFHITPNHFSSPIPDVGSLNGDVWERRSQLPGVDMNEPGQLALLSVFASEYRDEYESLPREKTAIPHQYYVHNVWFDSVDGEILYCMIRHFKPRMIFEIGSGNTTYLSAQAILKNEQDEGLQCELIACEPYPNDVLKAGFPGLTKLLSTEVQNVPLKEFERLQENDILFIDSSHYLKIGGDVYYEFLEILPRLNKGVIVHIHDIFFPAEYPREWVVEDHLFCTEQYLLQAFLVFNQSFEVLWGGSYMHLNHADKLEKSFGSYTREGKSPRSFWIRKIR
jgi:predicted O-methyltransferase YrrM